MQQQIKADKPDIASIPGSNGSSLFADLPYLGVRLRSHQSNIAQRTEQAESSGAFPSLHAHLCQNGMQAPCPAHTPAGSVNLKHMCSTQSVVMTCHAPQVVKTAITVKVQCKHLEKSAWPPAPTTLLQPMTLAACCRQCCRVCWKLPPPTQSESIGSELLPESK